MEALVAPVRLAGPLSTWKNRDMRLQRVKEGGRSQPRRIVDLSLPFSRGRGGCAVQAGM